MKSFLQTTEWLEFQRSIGRKAWRFSNGSITANIVRHNVPFGKNYLYIPYGPEIRVDEMVGGIRNELSLFVAYLKNLACEEKSFYIKIEPLDDKVPELFHQFGFKKSNKELQPKRSVILDLETSEEGLLMAMHHKTRYNIKVGEKYGLKFITGNNIDAFWELLELTAKNDNFSTHPKKYYEKLCTAPGLKTEMVFVEHEGVLIAGAVLLVYGDTVYYLHGAMDRDPKYKPMMAPYFLHWEVIKWAKGYGMKHYDLWGIDASKWPGVTRFKLGWLGSPKHGEGGGGRQVEYPGAFDLPISKMWYLTYKVINKIRQ
jgi:peptidoglycan pentaglycine glycine transferase (the first glycine)